MVKTDAQCDSETLEKLRQLAPRLRWEITPDPECVVPELYTATDGFKRIDIWLSGEAEGKNIWASRFCLRSTEVHWVKIWMAIGLCPIEAFDQLTIGLSGVESMLQRFREDLVDRLHSSGNYPEIPDSSNRWDNLDPVTDEEV
jgi:hypothetical protein